MARLSEHYNCPNPVQWGASPIKTVYVRDTEGGKTSWRPIGRICTGCGVFRSKLSGWFPNGKTDPLCEPWKPPKPGLEPEVEDSAHDGDDKAPIEAKPSVIVYAEEIHDSPFTQGPISPEEDGRPRVTIRKLQKLLGLEREEVIAGVNSGEIPIQKDKHRHWSVDRAWYDNKRMAIK